MRELSMSAAIREALYQILREDNDALLIGEDIGVYGGAFKITAGAVDEFGADRIIDTPISEAGFVSMAAGAALMGSRPIVEIMFMDFMALAFDGIINIAAKWQEIYGDEFSIPLIIRSPAGAGRNYGPTHSQSFEGLLMNVPNLIICCPSNPADAAGLLLGAYETGQTVIFVEHKSLYARKGQVPDALELVTVGKGNRIMSGDDVSLFCYGRHVMTTYEAARQLEAKGIHADVIDLRTIKPLDKALILESMEKTGKGISIEESPKIGGVGAEISAVIMEDGFDCLEAPFTRLGAKEKAIPCNKELETDCFPDVQEIVETAERLVNY